MADKPLRADSPAVIVAGCAAIAAVPGLAFGRIFACGPAALLTALVLGALFGGGVIGWQRLQKVLASRRSEPARPQADAADSTGKSRKAGKTAASSKKRSS